ncbi:50S ribosomal protein L11 methyltransferase [Robiginitalea sp. M366]|uniref:50S ribosomal protein L11 methyltransferase n=1 Tax=Robiginitalea aestuariiviva TaxID=3036903 RepID=UPI00240DB636|nr:50S ribosomal protein L11 methyltransferase [Robiginitalea aestuariiviva]MDG1572241.1 50S ribosomal protein L11 methyltransferase [Robiginitalea aestuariiviva]
MYLCCTLELQPLQPASEIFIAALGELGFESFEETETGLKAYIRKAEFNPEALEALPYLQSDLWEAQYTMEELPQENWNARWESDYHPIRVGDACVVRAPFHPEPDPPVAHVLVIAPKMSFGTGHHQTTWLMLNRMLDMDFDGRAVLDMGSGTGVLAILAARKGARPVCAIDIDPWCFENCEENAARNQVQLRAVLGDAAAIGEARYDVILANINKNILLQDLPAYARALNPGGTLLLSGFYEADLEDLKAAAARVNLAYQDHQVRDQWVAAAFVPA